MEVQVLSRAPIFLTDSPVPHFTILKTRHISISVTAGSSPIRLFTQFLLLT